MDIGSNIQSNRKRLGLSQEELGQQLYVSRQTVSQWENGQTMPSIDNLLLLKDVFGISLDALCGSQRFEEASSLELPLQEYRFAPTRDDIKQLCNLTCRPALHRYLICAAICLAGIIASAFADEAVAPGFWIPFLLTCIFGFTLRFLKDRKALHKPLQANNGYEHAYQFYEDHFICFFYRNGIQTSWERYEYREIKKYYHTKSFVVMHAGNRLYPIAKDVFYSVAPLQHHQDTNPRKKALGPNVVIWRTVSLILFLASIASFGCIFLGTGVMNSYNHMETGNMWICFLFTPVPLASIVFGIISIRKGYPCKKNIVIGIIMTAVLCVYGCFSFIFANVYTDDPIGVNQAEHYLQLDIPEHDHISTFHLSTSEDPDSPAYIGYETSVYFDTDTTREILSMIRQDDRFMLGIPSELKGLTNSMTSPGGSDYVVLYNVDTGQCNEYPVRSGVYRMLMVTFCSEDKRMLITEYNINYTAN